MTAKGFYTQIEKKCENGKGALAYWNGYGRWYKLWREHNSYHRPILDILIRIVDKGTRVLDVGAGDGVLGIPLSLKGCHVTALEPSASLRSLLIENCLKHSVCMKIDPRRFEDLYPSEIRTYDLVLASNSLHLTELGIFYSLFRIFVSRVNQVFLVTEKIFDLARLACLFPEYRLDLRMLLVLDSSFAYHSYNELIEHWRFKLGRMPYIEDLRRILMNVSYEDGHIWIKEKVPVHIFHWRRLKGS